MQATVLELSEKLNSLLREYGRIVITAPPGAGKSTVLPLTMLPLFKGKGKILILEPRRLAARCIAERMAGELNEEVGATVGYRIRFENKISKATRIEVVTERILTRMITGDPTLEGIDCIIFDEFHERSLDTDLALALSLNCQNIIRPDLRIILMSATIDAKGIADTLGAELLQCHGRMYPVELCYSRMNVTAAIHESLRKHDGDILAFLPGEAEIRNCAESLSGTDGSVIKGMQVSIKPLYGMLSNREQQEAIAPSAPGYRKVVLATPIAETSLTIEGVRIVIDSGLYRRPVFNAQSALNKLETATISMDMATQRSGRAGRTAPGICYRLWDKGAESMMKDCRKPEILDADLSSVILDIAASGERDAMALPWITPPPAKAVADARKLLENLGAVGTDGRITTQGAKMAALPCHPRIASMLLSAKTPEEKALACDLAAIIEEKDPLPEENGSDICSRLRALHHSGGKGRNWTRLEKISSQYRKLLKTDGDCSNFSWNEAGALLAKAYPERIAKTVSYGRYLLASGETAVLDSSDSLNASDCLVVVALGGRIGCDGRIFMAAAVAAEDLQTMARVQRKIGWDSKEGTVIARDEARIGRILLWQKPAGDIDRDAIVQAIVEAVPREGLSMFSFDEDFGNLQRRIATVAQWNPELSLPDFSTDVLLERAGEWLPQYIGKASTRAELKKINLALVIWNMLDYDQQQAVERLAPSHITVPTGSRIKLEYRVGTELPVLRVRLQECFGLTETPRVNNGKVKVLMDLLSPGFKSVQLTSDLASFWSGTYFEVRKELRMRYPKHSWPENPLEAEAVRGTARKKTDTKK